MPRNPGGSYSLPAGSIVTDGTSDILASQHNNPLNDIAADLNLVRPIVAGGTGAAVALQGLYALGERALNATYGGTANAITLTTGASIASLATGTRLSFTPTSANTGATTISMDGLGAIAVQPLARSGVALPSGYIRANVPVTAVYNGTVWLIERQTEYGTNGNGEFWRMANGEMICTKALTGLGPVSTGSGSFFSSASIALGSFAAAFSAVPRVGLDAYNAAALQVGVLGVAVATTSAMGNAVLWRPTTSADTNYIIDVTAVGLWY
jgi:hypothetical protein